MTKYEQLLSMEKKEIDQQDVYFKVKEAKLQLSADRTATEKRMSQIARELAQKKATFPLDAHAIIDLQNKYDNLDKGLKAIDELDIELFSEVDLAAAAE